jgi:Spx/MgsR family transcriptional regulator
MTVIYGIKNCDTMKKAITWLEGNTIPFTFHDYKKQGLDEDVLRQAINEHGWETVINRRGTTWRALPDSIKENMDDEGAVAVAKENPSIIKRPLLVYTGTTHLGFKKDIYADIFKT